MDKETNELFNALIKKMDRMQERTNNKIDAVQSSINAFKEENRNQHEQMMHEILKEQVQKLTA